jgi:hypothetical protein
VVHALQDPSRADAAIAAELVGNTRDNYYALYTGARAVGIKLQWREVTATEQLQLQVESRCTCRLTAFCQIVVVELPVSMG